MAQIVKYILALQETSVSFLGGEDLQEKRMATSILAWRIPWTEETGRLQSMGSILKTFFKKKTKHTLKVLITIKKSFVTMYGDRLIRLITVIISQCTQILLYS